MVIETLVCSVESLTAKVGELEKRLVEKDACTQKMVRQLNSLAKITLPKKIEKRKVESLPAKIAPTPKERGNNGAKRKVYDLEEVIEEVEPTSALFKKEEASLLFYRDVVRYTFIPPRLIKHIYRCKCYRMGDAFYEGPTPVAPFLNSNYDSSVMAHLLQQRFVYGLPVERIVKYYQEMGIDLSKSTAHGLITKAAEMPDQLNPILKEAVLSEAYVHFDETYHTLIDKQRERGSRKAYFWAAPANKSKLIHLFYDKGSRAKKVFTDYLPTTYSGTIQTDGYSSYKSIEGWDYPQATRIGCVQHCKRKFFDIETQPQAKEIIELYNQFYQIRKDYHPDKWVEESLKVFNKLEKRLKEIERDTAHYSNKVLLDGVGYCLNELESIREIIVSTEFDLDNNQIERPMRYISTSRKNSMFCGSDRGAQRMATIYSLSISCRLLGINTFEYFKNIIHQMALLPPRPDKDQLRKLLPDRWAK